MKPWFDRRCAALNVGVLLCLLGLVASPVAARDFPVKPVRLVIPYTAGGPVDIVGRALQTKLQEIWGQQMIIDNRPGASAMIGSEFVAKAAPDGYTLLLAGIQTHAMNVATVKKMLYDPVRDFTPIVETTRSNWIVAANASMNVKTVQELVAKLKAEPDRYSYGSSGVGGLSHLAFEMLKAEIGIRAIHVPYKGTSQAVTDMVGGQIQMVMGDHASLIPHARAGKIVLLAMTGNVRSRLIPDVPTLSETIAPGFNVQTWQGVFGPPGMSADLVRLINADVVKALAAPEINERLRTSGYEPVGSTVEAFTTLIPREVQRWSQVGKSAGIQPE
jgi:tripartite-type tricarboxylate transporter receptor subunit TctC